MKDSLEALMKLVKSSCPNKTSCDKCDFEKACNSFAKGWIDTIKQDLERLEKLNNIFSDSHICEIKAKFNEIECNADKCKTCPLGVGDGICLNNIFEHKWKLEEENAKLKQAIEILKDRKNILKYNGLKGTYELGWLTQEEYELLKEVLGNE